MSVFARKRKTQGQALVEFALVIGILLVFVLGVIGIWPVLNAGDAISMAASSGAHEAAITGGNQAQVEAIVRENLMASGIAVNADDAIISITCGGSCERYAPMTVQVTVPVRPWFKMPFYKEFYLVSASYTRASEVDGANSSSPSNGTNGTFLGTNNTIPGITNTSGPSIPGDLTK